MQTFLRWFFVEYLGIVQYGQMSADDIQTFMGTSRSFKITEAFYGYVIYYVLQDVCTVDLLWVDICGVWRLFQLMFKVYLLYSDTVSYRAGNSLFHSFPHVTLFKRATRGIRSHRSLSNEQNEQIVLFTFSNTK